MAVTIAVSRWDDSAWDDGGNAVNLVVPGGTFTVSAIDQNNRVVTLTPQNLLADNFPNQGNLWSPTIYFSVGQSWTCSSVDLNNRIAYLTG